MKVADATSATNGRVERRTIDLSGYPDLVVIYLGMRVNALSGLKTLFGFGPKIARSVQASPDGLLLHENFLFSLIPPHAGMRQYWRDFESLERWARSEPHRIWWQQFLRNPGGTGFWHEAYFMRGGMEAVYDDMVRATGFLCFAPAAVARGAMFSARGRARQSGEASAAPPVPERELTLSVSSTSRIRLQKVTHGTRDLVEPAGQGPGQVGRVLHRHGLRAQSRAREQ